MRRRRRGKKFDGGVTGQSTTSTPWKFDAVSRRNSTAPGSTTAERAGPSFEPPFPQKGTGTAFRYVPAPLEPWTRP